MRKLPSKQWVSRALLTDTLPYEVPVIFSNDKFHAFAAEVISDPALKKASEKLLGETRNYTVPYNYSIRKDSSRTTMLGVVHPLWQRELAAIYTQYEGTLMSYCAKSEFSLRRPIAVASVYTDSPVDPESDSSKTGIVLVDPSEDEIDSKYLSSYFTYGKYNLLGKFHDSREFVDLEGRFRYLRTLDISKCFYHIYTHSIGWAVKSKSFAKLHSSAYSFEAHFDKAMQRANYNETNGIVVGPEISRIFAEIILQEADLRIQDKLLCMGLTHNVDYSIRRYVDDYYIFASTATQLDKIEPVVSEALEAYKLYLNIKKAQTFERPFLSPLTMGRAELVTVFRELEEIANAEKVVRSARRITSISNAIRTIVKKNSLDFSSITGWSLAFLKRLVKKLGAKATAAPEKEKDDWLKLLVAVLELVFYLCAVDLRVRTTYNLCQIAKDALSGNGGAPARYVEVVTHHVNEGLIKLIKAYDSQHLAAEEDRVELYNLLICGAHYIGSDFVDNGIVQKTLRDLSSGARLTYFMYIALKFCLLKSSGSLSGLLVDINARAEKIISSGDPMRNSEEYLLLTDYLSAPDIEEKAKRAIFDKVYGGQISSAVMAGIVARTGFVDWSGVNVDHALARKELRPIYSVA